MGLLQDNHRGVHRPGGEGLSFDWVNKSILLHLCSLQVDEYVVVLVDRMRVRVGSFAPSLKIFTTYEASINIDV